MCGRYSITAKPQDVGDRFGVLFDDLATERVNVRPTQRVPAVVLDGEDRRGATLRWGLIPHWAKEESIGSRMINARAETLLEKTSFKDLVRSARHRCLIVADGFYEWARPDDPGQRRAPMRFSLKGDELFAFAGLWTTWSSPVGKDIGTCTIITTESNTLVQKVHDRMPVILANAEAESAWLDTSVDGVGACNLLTPLDSSHMSVRPATELTVGRAGHDKSSDEQDRL